MKEHVKRIIRTTQEDSIKRPIGAKHARQETVKRIAEKSKARTESITTPQGTLKKIKASELFGGDSSIHDKVGCSCGNH